MIDEEFEKNYINPIVGYIFHSAKQLGLDNAPNELDWRYLKEGTRRIRELVEMSLKSPTAPPAESEQPAVDDAKALEHKAACQAAAYWLRQNDPKVWDRTEFTCGFSHIGIFRSGFDAGVSHAERYAAKQRARQTPAIIEEFIAEAAEEVKAHATDCELFVFTEAMQAVKERRK